MQKTFERWIQSVYGICLRQHDELTPHWASKGTFDSALWMWTPWALFDCADSLSWFYHTCYELKTGIFKCWWLLNLTQLQLAGVILQWSRVVICEQRLEHNWGVTLLQALEDHAASPRVHGGPCACAGAVSVFGWGLRLDKERPQLLLLWHFSNW